MVPVFKAGFTEIALVLKYPAVAAVGSQLELIGGVPKLLFTAQLLGIPASKYSVAN